LGLEDGALLVQGGRERKGGKEGKRRRIRKGEWKRGTDCRQREW
jgi:hypothetical protein